MIKTTAFHPRLDPLNRTGVWKHWSGYRVAPRYQHSAVNEYYAIRNSAALLDTSPLFKYRLTGNDGVRLLHRVMARNIDTCRPGKAQYTTWCDARGFVLQDGVILHVSEGEYWMTSAEPALRWDAADQGAVVSWEKKRHVSDRFCATWGLFPIRTSSTSCGNSVVANKSSARSR